jgi:DNA-binding GntR family transcriptional regulator
MIRLENGQEIVLSRQSLAEQVFIHVKRMILSGQLRGGQRIPEESIAKAFGVSRTPIREALRKLEKNGLVKVVPRSHAEVVLLSLQDREAIRAVRSCLEALSVRTLAPIATDADIESLTGLADACVSLLDKNDLANVFETDNQFHLEIARRGGNLHLHDILEIMVHLIRILECTDPAKIRHDVMMHFPIIDALRNHDPDLAETQMNQHTHRFNS